MPAFRDVGESCQHCRKCWRVTSQHRIALEGGTGLIALFELQGDSFAAQPLQPTNLPIQLLE